MKTRSYQIRAFPNAEEVHFKNIRHLRLTVEQFSWEGIQTLDLSTNWHPWNQKTDFFSSRINPLRLRSLTSTDEGQRILEIISKHRLILHLDISYSDEHYETVSQRAPQLRSLRAEPCD